MNRAHGARTRPLLLASILVAVGSLTTCAGNSPASADPSPAAGQAVTGSDAAAPDAVSPATTRQRDSSKAGEASLARATFAGGCFWCMETAFEGVEGVVSATSGYAGGHLENPTYEQVSSGGTGHAEAVQVVYDPKRIDYARLLDIFWHNIDPTTPRRQFCDVGEQYRAGIFFHDATQRQLALDSKRAIEAQKRFDHPIVTEIVPLQVFYPAEEYHQDFYKKNPVRYKTYRYGCGRDRRLQELWGELRGAAPSHP